MPIGSFTASDVDKGYSHMVSLLGFAYAVARSRSGGLDPAALDMNDAGYTLACSIETYKWMIDREPYPMAIAASELGWLLLEMLGMVHVLDDEGIDNYEALRLAIIDAADSYQASEGR